MTGVAGHRFGPPRGGRRVILIHGLEAGWQSWEPLVDALGPSWDCVALDLPWRAGNDYRWCRVRDPAGWIHDAAERAEASSAASGAVVVAHSFGASAALEWIATRGPDIAAAVLIAPLFREQSGVPSWESFDRARRRFREQIAEGVEARLGDRAPRVDRGVLRRMVGVALDRIGPVGFLTAYDQFLRLGDLDVGLVETPVLVLAGTDDPTLTRLQAATLAARLPAGQVRNLVAHDHFCHVRRAPSVAREVRAFVHGTHSIPRRSFAIES